MRQSIRDLAAHEQMMMDGRESPGDLEMTRRTSEVAACCSSASVRCFCASASARLHASSCCFTLPDGCRLMTASAFVPLERSLRPRVGLFAPLRDKVTSSAQSLVPFRSAQPRIEPINPNRTAR